MSGGRGEKLLRLCASGASGSGKRKYCLVKILELNKFHILPTNEVKNTEKKDLRQITLRNKVYHVINIITGDYTSLDKTMKHLIRYENVQRKFKHLSALSVSTQTDVIPELHTDVEIGASTTNLCDTETIKFGGHSYAADVEAPSSTPFCSRLGDHPSVQDINLTEIEMAWREDNSQQDVSLTPEPMGSPTIQVLADYLFNYRCTDMTAVPIGSPPPPRLSPTQLERDVQSFGVEEYNIMEIGAAGNSINQLDLETRAQILNITQDVVHPTIQSNIPAEDITAAHVPAPEPAPVLEPVPVASVMAIPDESDVGSRKKRKQLCVYCEKEVFNLPRHVVSKHEKEPEVLKMLRLPLKCKERIRLASEIRRKGNALLNQKRLQEGKEPVPIRSHNPGANLVPCPRCGAIYSSQTVGKHYKACAELLSIPRNFKSILEGQTALKKTPPTVSEEMKTIILPGMRDSEDVENDLVNSILADEDVVEMGNMLCLKFSHEINRQKHHIRSKLRYVMKLKHAMMKMDDTIKEIRDIFSNEKWPCFIRAVKEISNLDSGNLDDSSPNTVANLGFLASGLAKDIKASLSIDEIGKGLREKISAWIECFERKYNSTIGSQTLKLAKKKKWIKRNYIPVAEDLILFNKYIKAKHDSALSILKQNFDKAEWENLNKFCILLLLVFNRKRIGEVANITVEDYKRKEKIKDNSDVFKGLTLAEKISAKRYYHVVIRGKNTKGVPLLIDEKLSVSLDKIIDLRPLAGVNPENGFLFGKGENGHFDANQAFKEAAYDCGAKDPKMFTSSRLRKHIASVAQSLNLDESELQTLSAYMGHTSKTHMEHYRLPSVELHTAKMSKLLMALDAGKILNYRGKRIDEINVDLSVDALDEEIEDFHEFEPVPTTSQGQKRTPTKTKKTNRTIITTPKKSLMKKKYISSPSPAKGRVRWTPEEQEVMRREFAKKIQDGKLPTPEECHQVRSRNEVLQRRRVTIMKAWVFNEINRIKRRKEMDENPQEMKISPRRKRRMSFIVSDSDSS